MSNEKLVIFAYFVENHLIERVWFARHVTANTEHMTENFTRNYRQLVFVLGVARTCCMVTKKAVLSVGQNQPKSCQRYVLMMLKNTMSDKERGKKHDTKKTRKTAYAHAVEREKQTKDIALAHFAEKQ